MPEQPIHQTPVPELQARLRDVAGLLREARSLDTTAQRALAELVEELTKTLQNENLPATEVEHLAEMTGHLEEAIHHQQDVGVIGKVREGLERAVASAETSAPVTVG